MKFTKEQTKDIIDLYNSGLSSLKIGGKYGVGYSVITKLLKSNGIKIRSNKINSRKYFCNDTIFHNIDSYEKAYWLGFIAADGYVTSSYGKKLGVTLSEKDVSHLEKLKSFIGYTGDIKRYTYSGYSGVSGVRLLVSSDSLYDDLVSHGVVEHKSSVISRPDIEDKYIPSWLLGYFDGDGSIGKYSSYYTLKFIGTESIINLYLECFLNHGIDCKNKAKNKRHDTDPVYYISFGGTKKIYNILSILYESVPEDIPLDRKYAIYKEMNSRFAK